MAVSQYDKEHLSQAQQDKIQQVTDAAKGGSMSWADAHKEAESIRSEAPAAGTATGIFLSVMTPAALAMRPAPDLPGKAPAGALPLRPTLPTISRTCMPRTWRRSWLG